MCACSPRKKWHTIIGNDKFFNMATNEILLRIQGADLRRFDKNKKRFYLTTAPP
jgi:hypothetical protein